MVFPVVMYGCESWTVKKAERQRIDAFELWCWRRLLRVPWTVRRSNQSILKEISPGCSLEGMMLKAETPVLWPPHVKSWLIGKDSDAGRDWGQEEKGMTKDEMAGWHHRLNGRESEWTLGVGVGPEAWCVVIHGVTKSRTRLSNWTELMLLIYVNICIQSWKTTWTHSVHCKQILISTLKRATLIFKMKINTKQRNGKSLWAKSLWDFSEKSMKKDCGWHL